MTSGRGPNTAWTSPATSMLIADRQCASRHCRNHSISRAPPVAALLGPSLAASAVRRSSPTCAHRAWRSRRAMEGRAAIPLADVRSHAVLPCEVLLLLLLAVAFGHPSSLLPSLA